MNPNQRNLIMGLGGAVLALAGIITAAVLLLAPAKAPASPALAAGDAVAACAPGVACESYPVPDPAQAMPPGLEQWQQTGRFALPAGAPATVLGIGPQGLVVLAGSTVYSVSLPGEGTAGMKITGRWSVGYQATAMAVAPDGQVFLASAAEIHRLSPGGEELGRWSAPAGSAPLQCLAVGADRLYVSSGQLRAVLAYGFDGHAEGRLEARPDQDFIVPGTHFPVCASAAGVTAVNPGRRGLQFFTGFGQQTAGWARSGAEWEAFQGCCNPISVAVLADGLAGNDRIVSAEKGVPRVKVVSREGRLLAVLEGPADLPGGIQDIGLAVDARGRVYVLDSVKQEIRIHERQQS